jgi:hypothetical protein
VAKTKSKTSGVHSKRRGKATLDRQRTFDREPAQKESPLNFRPPDPEGQNNRRSMSARAALRTFVTETGSDSADALCDILCNLMHFADRHGFSFVSELGRAQRHYFTETLTR